VKGHFAIGAMSEPAYVEGWRDSEPMEEIRRFRIEIYLQQAFDSITQEEKRTEVESKKLMDRTISELEKQYKYKPELSRVQERLDYLVRIGVLLRDQSSLMIRQGKIHAT